MGMWDFFFLLLDLDPPRDLEQMESTETSLTVRWKKPQAKVTGYRMVYVSRDGEVEEVDVPATATTLILPNLTPGMSYTLSLTAERGHRRSKAGVLSASTGGWGSGLSRFVGVEQNSKSYACN